MKNRNILDTSPLITIIATFSDSLVGPVIQTDGNGFLSISWPVDIKLQNNLQNFN